MENNYRITKGTATLMIGVALFFDVLQAAFGIFSILGVIPVIGVIFGIIGWTLSAIFSAYAWLTFFSWFNMKGVGYFKKPSRLVKLLGTALIEMSPFGILPTWTVFVISTILETWREDRKKEAPEESVQPQINKENEFYAEAA